MGRRATIVIFVLIISQIGTACGGFSPGGQPAPKPTEAAKTSTAPAAAPAATTAPAAKPTEAAAKPAEAAKPAATTAAAPKPTEASKPVAKGSGEVIVNGYAAEYEDLFNKHIKEPFERETGIRVIFDSTGSAAEDYAKTRASGGDPGWDVNTVTAQEAIQGAKEGLLLEITEENTPELKNFYPDMRKLVGSYGVPYEIQYMSLMYHKEKVQPTPDSWQIMWDPKVKGHTLTFQFANILGVYHMIMAAQINGGSIEDVEPGFQALERMKDNLLDWPQQSTQAVVHMERGEVWVMPYWDGRAHYYVNQGLPYDFVIPKEGSIPLVNSLIIPKGTKNKENAYRFVNYWLRKDVQREWALAYTVGPGRGDIDFPEDFKKRHITSEAQIKQMSPPDFDYIAKNRPAWTERAQRIMAR
jgi:putative spermidine/putrescine transport system substrate-binding protein